MATSYAPSPPHSGGSPAHSLAFNEEDDETVTGNSGPDTSLLFEPDDSATVTSEINVAPDRTREHQRKLEHLRRDSDDEESDFESDQDEDEEEIVNDDYDDEAAKEFAVAKAAYEDKKRKGMTDSFDDFMFSRLKSEEKARQEKKKRDEMLENPYLSEDDEEDSEDDTAYVPEKASKKRGRPQKDHVDRPRKKNKKAIRQYLDKAQGSKNKPRHTTTSGPSMMTSALANDVFKDAAVAANYAAPVSHAAAASNATNSALTTVLIANMPRDEKREARERWEQAKRNFSGRVIERHSDGSRWTVSGIHTPLETYQIEGVGIMRGFEMGETKGGILADAMGLGKTLQSIVNIINGRQLRKREPRATLIVLPRNLVAQWYEEIQKHAMTKSEHAKWGYSSIIRHYAGNRVDEANALKVFKKADFVLTTYDEVMRSYPRAVIPTELVGDPEAIKLWWKDYYDENKGLLHQATWHRVVLDEAQAIKNHTSRRSRACRGLEAEYRWAVTGTPIMNRYEEFYPYFLFLRASWVSDLRQFKKNFVTPGEPEGQDRLDEFLKVCMIRRTHAGMQFGGKLLDLPKPTNEARAIDFNIFERQVYKILEYRASLKVNKAKKRDEKDEKKTAGTTALEMILVLRQATCHPLLIPMVATTLLEREDYEKLKKIAENEHDLDLQQKGILADMLHTLKRTFDDAGNPETVVPTPSAGKGHGTSYRPSKYLTDMKSFDTFQEMNKRVTCCVCTSAPQQPYITDCEHIYCGTCLESLQDEAAGRGQDQARCVECAQFFSSSKELDLNITSNTDGIAADSSLTLLSKKKKEKDWIEMEGPIPPSAKTMAVKAQILNWQQEDPTAKIIIFTQWRPMIRILVRVCKEEGWGHCTFQGGMKLSAHETALKEFNNDPETKIFISTLKCGGEGLNLNVASRVISLDPWWNESAENQAFGRVYRIGQEKETFMTKFYVRGTIDERMLALQKTKQSVINAIMDKKVKDTPVEDLMALFGEVGKDGNGNAFIMPPADHVHDGSEQFADADEEAKSSRFGN